MALRPAAAVASAAAREGRCCRAGPGSQPGRRVAGAAVRLARFLESGLVAGLRLAAESGIPSRLTSALAAGKKQAGGRSLIGPGRARDLAVNVVLPFFQALETVAPESGAPESVAPETDAPAGLRGRGDPDQHHAGQDSPRYLQCYRRFGLLQDNELLREMRDRLFRPDWAGVIDSARRQQGLLHLHHLLRGGG